MTNSGLTPYFHHIVVKPDDVEEVTSGGIYIPDKVAEQHQQAQATGIIIALGPDAFIDSRVVVKRLIDGDMKTVEIREEGPNREFCPKVGDRVVFAKYGGIPVRGSDGLEYRLLNDRDLTSGAEESVAYTGIQSRKPIGSKR